MKAAILSHRDIATFLLSRKADAHMKEQACMFITYTTINSLGGLLIQRYSCSPPTLWLFNRGHHEIDKTFLSLNIAGLKSAQHGTLSNHTKARRATRKKRYTLRQMACLFRHRANHLNLVSTSEFDAVDAAGTCLLYPFIDDFTWTGDSIDASFNEYYLAKIVSVC